jgi:hypothetical protein
MLIYKKQAVFRNIIIFILLSIVFLFTIEGISNNYSVITYDIFVLFRKNWAIVLVGFITAAWIWTYRPYSRHAYIIFWILVSIKSFILLYSSFNKLVIVFNFIYLFFGFYFYTSLETFVKSAANVPNYSLHDIIINDRFKIKGHLFQKTKKTTLECLLTNLDSSSCFVLAEFEEKIKLGEQYLISFELEDVVFTSEALAISAYDKGVGFSFERDKDLRSMSGLYKVCLDRSIFG